MKKKLIESLMNSKGSSFFNIKINGFHYKNISGVDLKFHGKNITSTQFTNCIFKNCEFINCNFSASTFKNCTFINCKITSSKLFAEFNNCNLINIDLSGNDLRSFKLIKTTLKPISLFNCCGRNDFIYSIELKNGFSVNIYNNLIQLNRQLMTINDFKNDNYSISDVFPFCIIDNELQKENEEKGEKWISNNKDFILQYIELIK